MTPAQALNLIQVMADHSHNWYDGATTRESINDSLDNVDTKKRKENIHAIQVWERVKAETKMGHLKKQKDNPYKTRETVGIPEKIHKKKAQEDEGNMDDGWYITIKDVERLRQIRIPTIQTLPNLELVVQPYMPRGPVCDEVKVVREEELEYDIPLQNGVMQPLTPQTVYITLPDDDYVAPPTSPILERILLEGNVRIKSLLDDLRVTAAQVCVTAAKLNYYCSKIKAAERDSTVRERIKIEERIKILKEFDLLKWDPTRGILQLGQQVVSELVALRNFARRYGSRFCTHGGCIQSSHAQTGLQKLVSQLELLGEIISQEDVNQKLLRSLSPEWNTHVVVWRNKTDLDTMSMDDLYNNLKVYEPEVKGMSSSSSSTQNMAFVSSSNNNNSSTNGAVSTTQAVNTANGVC
ncbi:hypothetical protein Tco_0895127 [Tanacetum coccineum]|uniref:Uncharacterized protein n=1 Tax=Tanacetum coccineum TaxID=301880 RepID=A0ABQ5CE28_9ASTR